MNYFTLLLNLAILATCSAATNGHHYSAQVKTTKALQTTSTSSSTEAPKIQVLSSKSSIIKDDFTKIQATMENDMKMEVLPIEMPAMVNYSLQAEESKPLTVTGFITTNGSIYEIEDENGMGKIESRQLQEDEQPFICNYGSVVIYSDIPCEQVTNVRVSEVEEKPVLNQITAAVIQQQNQTTDNNADIKESAAQVDLQKPQNLSRRRAGNRRPNKNKNKKRPQYRPANNNKKRPQNRPVNNNNKRPQKRPVNNNNKRPNKRPLNNNNRPSKNKAQRPLNTINNNKKRPNKSPKKRPTYSNKNKNKGQRPLRNNYQQWDEEDYDENDDYDYVYEPYYQNQRKSQKLQPVHFYLADYDDY